jgi:surface antigen
MVIVLALLAGCQSIQNSSIANGTVIDTGSWTDCVPFARSRSGINIYGDAHTWWAQADGRYPTGHAPVPGAVMVLDNYAGEKRAHLAVVTRLVSDREIRVDHANWLNDGAIYLDNAVLDISPVNDWSRVRVWNSRSGAWGGRAYEVRGFIGASTRTTNGVEPM